MEGSTLEENDHGEDDDEDDDEEDDIESLSKSSKSP
jgi:hypothetical protein